MGSDIEESLRRPFRLFGVTFAPVLIPLARRLQTLSVIWILTVILSGPFVALILTYILFTSETYRWLVILYGAMLIYQQDIPYTGGMDKLWLRNFLAFNYITDYFPIKLIKTCDLDAK